MNPFYLISITILFLSSFTFSSDYYLAYFDGIEFGKQIKNNNSLAIRITPSLSSRFNDNDKTDSVYINRDYSIKTSFVLKKKLVQKTFFSLYIGLIPSYEYSKLIRALEVKDKIVETFNYEIKNTADIAVMFEPCFKPSPKVDVFWNLSTGASVAHKTSGSSDNSAQDINIEITYYYPYKIQVFSQLGVRYYFR